MNSSPALLIVATPIGNLSDVSLRALEVLGSVDWVAAEDTRRTRTLLKAHGVDARLVALHEHNEEQMSQQLVDQMLAGQSLALVSDAGTPLLSDPGYRLVRAAIEAGIRVLTVPGPSAITAALSVAGLATDRFCFEGFLPARSAAREQKLTELQSEPRTLVFFESSHRVLDSLSSLQQVFGDERQAAVCRELTKAFETTLRGSLSELRAAVAEDANQRKGEFVIVVSGKPHDPDDASAEARLLASALLEHLPRSKAAAVAARIHGVSRRQVYDSLKD